MTVRPPHFHSHDWTNCERLGNCSNIELDRTRNRVRLRRQLHCHFDYSKLAGAIDEHSADCCDSIEYLGRRLQSKRLYSRIVDMVTPVATVMFVVVVVVAVDALMHCHRTVGTQNWGTAMVARMMHAPKTVIDLDKRSAVPIQISRHSVDSYRPLNCSGCSVNVLGSGQRKKRKQ